MSLFEFVVVMISVILALAIAQLFVGVAEPYVFCGDHDKPEESERGDHRRDGSFSEYPSGNFPRRSSRRFSSHNYSVLARIGIGQHTG